MKLLVISICLGFVLTAPMQTGLHASNTVENTPIFHYPIPNTKPSIIDGDTYENNISKKQAAIAALGLYLGASHRGIRLPR